MWDRGNQRVSASRSPSSQVTPRWLAIALRRDLARCGTKADHLQQSVSGEQFVSCSAQHSRRHSTHLHDSRSIVGVHKVVVSPGGA